MPTYRVYYAEREAGGGSLGEHPHHDHYRVMYGPGRDALGETEWEEDVEGKNEAAALDAFFREHVRDRSELMWTDEYGSHAVEGVGDYEPDKSYIWVENGKMMEYQGIEESTPGMVTCPLCDGHGEVDVEIANAYLAGLGQEIVEEGSWG